MRENQIRKIMPSGHLVIVKVPKYRRKELEKEEMLVPEYIDGKIISILVAGGRKQCAVVVRDGLGRDIKVMARSVLKLKGMGDQNGSRVGVKPVTRRRLKRPKHEQLKLFEKRG